MEAVMRVGFAQYLFFWLLTLFIVSYGVAFMFGKHHSYGHWLSHNLGHFVKHYAWEIILVSLAYYVGTKMANSTFVIF
jgi:hypothetical protein